MYVAIQHHMETGAVYKPAKMIVKYRVPWDSLNLIKKNETTEKSIVT